MANVRSGHGGRYPLTDAQAEKWLGSRYSDEAGLAFVEACELALDGRLDVDALLRAFDRVTQRHEALSMRFDDDGSAQTHEPPSAIELQRRDFSAEADPSAAYAGFCAQRASVRLDPSHPPLVEAWLCRLAQREWRLLLRAHHLVVDGWSLRIVLQDLAAHYNDIAGGTVGVGKLPRADSWIEYVQAERDRRDGEAGQRSLAYWLKRYRDLPEPLRLPTDHPRRPRLGFAAATLEHEIPASLWQRLRATARERGVTRFSLLLAGYCLLMHRLTGQDDIVCGIPFAGAARGAGARVVGDTGSTLPLRIRVVPEEALPDFLRRVHSAMQEAIEYQDVSLGRIVEALAPAREPGRMLLVESIMSLNPAIERLRFHGVDCRLRVMPHAAMAWELAWQWRPLPGRTLLELQYRTDLYRHATARAWCESYVDLLAQLVQAGDAPVADIGTGTATAPGFALVDERDRGWNVDASLPELLDAAFVDHAGRCAAQCGDQEIDYAALDRASRTVASALLARGVAPGQLVGICMARSIDMLVAVLAVLRSGAAYVPLDPSFPAQRLRWMARHAGLTKIVASDPASLPEGLAEGRDVLAFDALAAGTGDIVQPLPRVDADSLAYVLYTSGSTGEPKGVRIVHRNLVNFLCAMRESPGFSRDDAICAATTLSFDIAALELFLPLLCGGRVVIADENQHRDPEALCRLIERRGCTVFQTTPSMMALVQDVGRASMLAPLRLLVGGEALPLPLAEKLAGQCRELWNMYGPTETTVWSSVQRIEPGATAVALGLPIAHTRLYVLDARRRPALPHAIGEIWIGGAGVADGYLHRPDLTAERFVPDPFAADGSRMYRTGDLGRLRDSRLYFHGRIDDQIKLRGYRIEPGDIEAAVATEAGVSECVVVARRMESGDDALVLYVAGELPPAELVPALRAKLRRTLPAYMRPQYVEVLERLPKTPNGKIDRRALPAPSKEVSVATCRLAPRTALEHELCELWQRLLRCGPIGVDDDFFELGGSSLLAVRMFAELHRRHGVDLPLATLIERPTVAALAEALPTTAGDAVASQTAHDAAGDRWRPLLRMQHGGTWPPLFLFHAVGGNVLNYHPLLEALDTDQPVYGLQSIGLDGTTPPLDDIAAMADAYVEQIARVQPRGPLLLAGGSMGGIVALEAARRLGALGRDVALLAMFDTYAPGASHGPAWCSLVAACRAVSRIDAAQRAGLLRRLRMRFLDVPWVRVRRMLDPSAREPLVLRLRRIERANHRALARHVQQRYAGDVQLIRAPLSHGSDGTLGWKAWIEGHVEVHELPGSHHDFIARPELGRRLRQRIALAIGSRQ